MHAFMSNRAEATAPDERAQSARRAARARRTRALDALDANSSWAMRDIRAEGAALTEAATSNDEDTRDLNADLIVLTHPFLEIQVKRPLQPSLARRLHPYALGLDILRWAYPSR
jgi:hypothetical protein